MVSDILGRPVQLLIQMNVKINSLKKKPISTQQQ